jgi:hypothetical protein
MIERLVKVTDNLYRGSAPTPKDLLQLKKQFHINKIVSLDRGSGERIDRACKLLGIKQEKIYLDGSKKSLINLLKHNLKELLISDGPTFVHCHAGKDRTGLVIGMYQCKYMGMDPAKVISDAKKLGFGVGIDPKITRLYEKLIKKCAEIKDTNAADIVSNQREYISDNRSSSLDESQQSSFAPYLNQTRQNPMDAVYNYINDQSPTRENYNRPIIEHDLNTDQMPQVGVFNNDAGGRGFGPTENYGGFFYD